MLGDERRPAASRAASSKGPPACAWSISRRPSVIVGPGSTALTVTPRPGNASAKPRATASWAVLVMPYWTISAGIWMADSLEMNVTRPQPRSSMPGR